MIKVLELFGGIAACSKALERQNIEHKIVDYVEIDKYAVKSFNAIHNTNYETQDICLWDKDVEVDLIMHGSPCQDFSTAGLQAGGDEGSGTRSSLMYETIRIIKKLNPKFIIWENVKNLLSKKHKHNFDNYIEALDKLGYNSWYKVLDSKDYGIPQHRERVFTISAKKGLLDNFAFPAEQELKLKLGDILEQDVDEKYYLSSKLIQCFVDETAKQKEKGNNFKFEPLESDSIAKTITTKSGSRLTDNYVLEQKNLKQKLCDKLIAEDKVKENDVIRHSYTKSRMAGEMKDIRQNNIAPTLDTRCDCLGVVVKSKNRRLLSMVDKIEPDEEVKYIDAYNQQIKTEAGTITTRVDSSNCSFVYADYRIRKLTPKECWRLMGFDDSDFEKAAKVNSNAQLYKQAGNSIVVNVLEEILKQLFSNKNN